MYRLTRSARIERSPADVFALVSDPARARELFVGITRWEPRSRRRRGVGARYRVLARVGSIQAGGTLVVTGWKPGELVAWKSEDGIDQRGRWRLRAAEEGTDLTLEIEDDLPGPAGRLVERLAGRMIGRDMTATLLSVRRLLEFEDVDGPARGRRPEGSRGRPGRPRAPRARTSGR